MFREVGPKTGETFLRPRSVGFGDQRGDRKGGWDGQDGAKIGSHFSLGQKTTKKNCHHPGDPVHSALSRLGAVVGTRRGERSERLDRSERSEQSGWLKWSEQLGKVHPQILILVRKKNDLVISPDQFVSMTSREGLTYSFSKLYLLKTTRRLYGLCVLRSYHEKIAPL